MQIRFGIVGAGMIADIHAQARYFPVIASTRVFLAEAHNISKLELLIHRVEL